MLHLCLITALNKGPYHELSKQDWIHGNPVADGWAGAVLRKNNRNSKMLQRDRRTDGSTNRVRDLKGLVATMLRS